jgi:hypothetical protein
MTEERWGNPLWCPKATFNILMAKYNEGRAGIRGHENRTIQNTKLNSPISLSQASTSIIRSSCGKRSWTPPRQNSEGRDRRQLDYLSTSYFPVGPPMLGPWGTPPMICPPCTPLVGWYGPWTPPPLHFHRMARTYWGFWPRWLLHRRWPLRIRRPLAG